MGKMKSSRPTCGEYGGKSADGSPCARVAGWGTDHKGKGLCLSHRVLDPESDGSPESQLNGQQLRFVCEYLGDAHMNAEVAAETAGFHPNYGYHLLKNPKVRKVIHEKLEAVGGMTTSEVKRRMGEWGRGSMEHFLRIDDHGNVQVDLSTDQARHHLHLLKKIEQRERWLADGTMVRTFKIEIHDAVNASEKVAKIAGLYDDGAKVNIGIDLRSASDQELVHTLAERQDKVRQLLAALEN